MVWPSSPSTVEELPVVGFNRHKFSVLSAESEKALCELVAANCVQLEQMTQGDTANERALADLLVDAAVAVQVAGARHAAEVIIV